MGSDVMLSVALAAYNGSAYLREQVASILPQLKNDDQLIISVDPSTDDSLDLARAIAAENPCVTVLEGPGAGVAKNFEQAIAASRGSYVFLSDQDDLWQPNKVARVLEAFDASGATLVLHDAQITDAEATVVSPSFFAWRNSRPGFWQNILRNSYIGCCVAFRSSLIPAILPIPEALPVHDQWIGLLAERHGGVCFLDELLVKYRRHAANLTATTHAPAAQMATWRLRLLRELARRERELRG
jgi:glycosyltransferase involved in cell wall biosynthesis